MTTTPLIGAPDWAASQASPWNPENQSKRMIEALARSAIIEDRDLTAPPGSCADGACYLVKATATGAWATYDGKLAIAVGANAASGWYFVTVATEGVTLYVKDEDIRILYDGSAWTSAMAHKAKSYTVGTVPSAATLGAGAMIYVSDESGGAVIAFSDGTNWKRVTDRATIS